MFFKLTTFFFFAIVLLSHFAFSSFEFSLSQDVYRFDECRCRTPQRDAVGFNKRKPLLNYESGNGGCSPAG